MRIVALDSSFIFVNAMRVLFHKKKLKTVLLLCKT